MSGNGSRVSVLMAGLVLLGVLGGCGGTHSDVVRSNFVEFTPEEKAEIAARSGVEYEIQEGDILKLAFYYQRELNQEGIVVLNDGSINLVGVDRIPVAGLTMAQADSVITEAYSREYREPSLSVIVQETIGRKVYVLGEVNNPGLHRVPVGGLDIMGAIGVAGGFNKDAAKSGTTLVRVTPDGYLAQEIDLDGFTSSTYSALALTEVQSYDIIYVPRSRMGDFGYFSSTILSGLVQIARIAADVKYLSGDTFGRVF